MRRPHRRILPTTTILAALLLAFAQGCSSERPAARLQAPEQAEPVFAAETGSGGQASAQGFGGGWSGGWGGRDNHTATVMINGQMGGTVHVGRFTLTIPRGAFLGTLPITVTDPQTPVVECRLFPEGLYFNVPVTLEVSLYGTTGDVNVATIYWQDPMTSGAATWVDLEGSYNPERHSVKASLNHFSVYRPGLPVEGRAGW